MVNVEDGVEILDNGTHLGWADLIDGVWTFNASALQLKEYRLTARYKTVASSPEWNITVKSPVDTEDFNDAPIGFINVLERPFYRGVATVQDATRFVNANIAGGGSERYLRLYTSNVSNGYITTTFEMTFKDPYAQISFYVTEVYVGLSPCNASVSAVRADGGSAPGLNFQPMSQGSRSREITLSAGGGVPIKSIKFVLTPGALGSTADLRIDNFRLVR